MINQLPEPVKKYLNLVLPDNYSVIRKVRLSHDGFFRTSPKSNWVKIKGEQSFNSVYPEFIWKGKTKLFKATDSFVNGRGRLKVRLLGIIPIVDTAGPEVDQAELLRWLGESVWFPTNLLPGQNLSWSPIDSQTASLEYKFKNLKIFYTVRFNESGYISKLETERFMEKGKLVRWIGKVSDYQTFDEVRVPRHIEATWKLDNGDFQYVDFYVKTLAFEY